MTSIEWLYKLSKERELDKFDLEQAKQMEETELEHAYDRGHQDGYSEGYNEGYNEGVRDTENKD